MTAATKEPKPQPSLAEVALARMTKTIDRYRELVARASSGAELPEKMLLEVVDLLAVMHLPESQWLDDIAAERERLQTAELHIEAREQMPAAEVRAEQTHKKISQLEDELKQLREQHYRDTSVLPRKIAGYGQRLNELAAHKPHLFVGLEDAARLRLQAINGTRPAAQATDGWGDP